MSRRQNVSFYVYFSTSSTVGSANSAHICFTASRAVRVLVFRIAYLLCVTMRSRLYFEDIHVFTTITVRSMSIV